MIARSPMNPFPLTWGLIAVAILEAGVVQEPLTVEHFSSQGASHPWLMTRKSEGALRVLVGGALAGSSSEQEAFVAEVLETSGLDAVAVGYEDLSAQGPDRRPLLSREKIPFVCANVKGAGRAYVVRSIGGTRVAFVGVTKIPAYRKDFEVASGWTLEDPAARVKALLPTLSKEADLVVLLAVMDRLECADLVKSVGGIHLALVPAGSAIDPEPLPVGGTALVQSSATPSSFSRTTLATDGKTVSAVSNHVESVELSEADRERAKTLHSRHQEGVDVERLVAGITIAPPPGPVKETGPLTALLPGTVQPVVVGRSDGSVAIRVDSIQVVPELGDRKAPENQSWLVVRSEWKNMIPTVQVDGRRLPTAYSVSDPKNNLYVIADGRTLCGLDVDLSAGADGLLAGRSIGIPSEGSTRKGNLVFPIPSADVRSLELQFYDFRHGPTIFPLLGRPQEAQETPIVPAQRNEILEVGVFKVTRGKGGPGMPEGTAYATLDVRARSLVTLEIEGRRIGVPGDLQGVWDGLRLASDGGPESAPEKGLPETPRFLPGAMTGCSAVFKVPEQAANLELRWTFSEVGLPDGRTLKPAPLKITLGGKAAAGAACPKCGHPADLNDKFCEKCGTKLKP